MFLESFRHLIEIEALKGKIEIEENKIASENKRISDLLALREKKNNEISELDQTLRELKLTEQQLTIDSTIIKLNRMTSQLTQVSTEKEQVTLENQIKNLKLEVATLEEKYFSGLEESEKIESEISDRKEFMKGSLETIKEIEAEIAIETKAFKTVIENYQKRVDSLMDLLHPSLKSLYLEVEKKYKKGRPVAYLIDKKCSQCHMLMDSMLKLSLEEGRSLECCPSCSRLLIPETAKIY